MKTVEEIIKSKYAHEVYHGIRDRIFSTKCGDSEPYSSYAKRLSEGERIVILVNGFIRENTNGGLDQFLTNSSGDYAEETLSALQTIGADVAVAALKDIRDVVYDGLPIPAERSQRCDKFFAWEDEDEERAEALFKRHDTALGWCESIELAVANYIRSNPEEFE